MSIILWSWTFVILFLALTISLEVPASYQWISLILGAIFVVLCWAQVHYRHIYLEAGILRISRVMNHQWVHIDLADVKSVHVSKYRLGFVYGGKIYSFLLPANSVIEIANLIDQAKDAKKEY